MHGLSFTRCTDFTRFCFIQQTRNVSKTECHMLTFCKLNNKKLKELPKRHAVPSPLTKLNVPSHKWLNKKIALKVSQWNGYSAKIASLSTYWDFFVSFVWAGKLLLLSTKSIVAHRNTKQRMLANWVSFSNHLKIAFRLLGYKDLCVAFNVSRTGAW